jgi:hypothetical protein
LAALPGSLTWQPCPAVLPVILIRHLGSLLACSSAWKTLEGTVSSGLGYPKQSQLDLFPPRFGVLLVRHIQLHPCSRSHTAAVVCLLVLYSIKQFVKLPLQQGSSAHSCMQFGILPLQQGSIAVRIRACSLVSCQCITVTAVWEPAAEAGQRHAHTCSLRTCCCSRAVACTYMQFENRPL